jgi:hypothetical protein
MINVTAKNFTIFSNYFSRALFFVNCSVKNQCLVSQNKFINTSSLSSISFYNSFYGNSEILKINSFTKNALHPLIQFSNSASSPREIIFRDVNLSKVNLTVIPISNCEFVNCYGEEDRGRVLISLEISKYSSVLGSNVLSDNGIYQKEELRNAEIIYRQLKQYYTNKQNYNFSGKFYVSEMEMARKRMSFWPLSYKDSKGVTDYIRINFGSLILKCFYSFYNWVSRYNYNFTRPVGFLIFLIFFYWFIYIIIYNCRSIWDNLYLSISNSIPLVSEPSIKMDSADYWIQGSQTFLCGLLLVMIILSLRKSFR